MKGTCEHCLKENQYLYRVPIATPEGDSIVEMWCEECLNANDDKIENE